VSTPPLWKHQEDAVDFAMQRTATLWHMGLGTGKSRCAIEFKRRIQAKATLILCPLSVCEAWREQHQQFSPESEVIVLNKGSVAKKLKAAQAAAQRARQMCKALVVVVNYESARNAPLSPWLEEREFDLLVLDESHRIKSPKGKTSTWVAKLAKRCKRRVALTGTVLPHSPLDIWAQARALTLASRDAFGPSFFRFRRKYAKLGGWGGKQVVGFQHLDDLRHRMSHWTFQVDRSVLDLPAAMHERRTIDLSTKAMKLYRELDAMFCAQVKGGEITASNALVKLLRLQQLTGGTAVVEDADGTSTAHRIDTAKEDALADLLTDIDQGEPVVVFAKFRGDLQSVHNAAQRVGRQSLELSGTRRELEEWQRGDAPILAVQLQSGGTGVDLTKCGGRPCSITCYLSTGFSLGDYEQSLARVHRPGQTRSVVYYHFVARDTVDERVYGALRSRKNIVEAVLDGIYTN